MTPKQADKAILSGNPIRVSWPRFGETAQIVLVRRSGRVVYTADGAAFDRTDMQIVPAK